MLHVWYKYFSYFTSVLRDFDISKLYCMSYLYIKCFIYNMETTLVLHQCPHQYLKHLWYYFTDMLLESFVSQTLYFNLTTGDIQSITAVTSDKGPDLGPVTTLSVPIVPRKSRPLKIKATITDTGSKTEESTQDFKVWQSWIIILPCLQNKTLQY